MSNETIDIIDEIISQGIKKEILHLNTKDKKLYGNILSVDLNKQTVNFGSCSYLGLEFNEELRRASAEAIHNYGTQFSMSRAYMSSRYYNELEQLFNQIFETFTIVTPTTTLGHLSAIPVLISKDDAVILDHQVHHSVQIAVNSIKFKGVYTELLRHNRMDLLEERVKLLRKKYKKIWYLADGIYSMYGDTSPVGEVIHLLNKYPELYYYVDDAHGMSCYGKHGRGYVLSEHTQHEKMIVIVSLAKAFATGGAVLVFPNKELARKVRNCGSTLICSGPMQPATLGAAIASAKIHLSSEIYKLQGELNENIQFANLILKKYHLPVLSQSNSPVFFIGVSLPKIAYSIINKMLKDGYYLNLGIFPAVPIKNTGIRFTITRLHTFQQIESMITTMSRHFTETLEEEHFTLDKIYQAFKLVPPIEQKLNEILAQAKNQENLIVQHATTIFDMDKQMWNKLLGERGTYDWDGLRFLEESFTKNNRSENNWNFDYILIKDGEHNPVLATFFTTSLWKDDLMAPRDISKQIELQRKTDYYYLTSKVVSLGSSLTAGEHLYLDKTSPYADTALSILFDKAAEIQEKYSAASVILRDFCMDDEKTDMLMVENGYFKVNMPHNNVVNLSSWITSTGFINTLTQQSKKNLKRYVLKHSNKYETALVKNPGKEEIEHWYELYLNVKRKSYDLNTFILPLKLFENMIQYKSWEIMTLTLKPEYDNRPERKPVAVMFNYVTNNNYNFVMVGIDYDFQPTYKCYKQALYQVLLRAKQLNKTTVNMGYTASDEKRKYGARKISSVAYMQVKDNYSLEVISSLSNTTRLNIPELEIN